VFLSVITAGCARRDDAIAADARARLAALPVMQGASVSVIVKKGVVLLRGHAVTAGQPTQATTAVAHVDGVHQVINQLTLTDTGIRDAIEQAFRKDPLLAGVPIDISVGEGVVRLKSNATGADHRRRAVQIARAFPGVTRVEDEMK
jgi:osmotically-inducible protein OsmY